MNPRLVEIKNVLASMLRRAIAPPRPADDVVSEQVRMALHAFKRTSAAQGTAVRRDRSRSGTDDQPRS
jgi:hypothetical protein